MPVRVHACDVTRDVGTSSRREVTCRPVAGEGSGCAFVPSAPLALPSPPCCALSSAPKVRSLCLLNPAISNQATSSAACSAHREGKSIQRKLRDLVIENLTKLQKPVFGNWTPHLDSRCAFVSRACAMSKGVREGERR